MDYDIPSFTEGTKAMESDGIPTNSPTEAAEVFSAKTMRLFHNLGYRNAVGDVLGELYKHLAARPRMTIQDLRPYIEVMYRDAKAEVGPLPKVLFKGSTVFDPSEEQT